MNEQPKNNQNTQNTVFDAYGNPISNPANQPSQQSQTQPIQPQVVYMARPLEPVTPHLSDAVLKKHEESKQLYPMLNLSAGEYVISAIRRHPIGLVSIWAVVGLIIVLSLSLIPVIMNNSSDTSLGVSTFTLNEQSRPMLALLMLSISALFFLGGVISTIVYNANRFFLTNESVVQHIQTSLFSKKEQTISLANIEDASFRQHGIIQQLFSYGSLRLSTEGDETTYRFNYVSQPNIQLNLLNNAVESFKNGRPVDPNEDS